MTRPQNHSGLIAAVPPQLAEGRLFRLFTFHKLEAFDRLMLGCASPSLKATLALRRKSLLMSFL
jgi:hypothetical protein